VGILSQALQAVQENVRALIIYWAITVSASTVGLVANAFIEGAADVPAPSAPLLACRLGRDVFLVVCYAFAQSIAFARFGKDIDRPLWKIAGDKEAVKRFFKLWLVLNAMVVACYELFVSALVLLDSERLAAVLFPLFALAGIVYVPVGACIMFYGRFERQGLGEGFAPLMNQWPKALVLLCANGLLFFFSLYLIAGAQDRLWLQPIVDVIFGYFDCLIFAATWLICMADRHPPDADDVGYF